MPMPRTEPSALRRALRYPLVVILIGFVLFLPVSATLFSLLTRLFSAALGVTPYDDPRLPTDARYGWAQLLAAVLVAALAIYAYRFVIVRGCEGRSSAPELVLSARARGIVLGVSVAPILITVATLFGGTSSTATASRIPWALGLSIFAGVVGELFARGTLLRISEQHLGTLVAITISASFFGLQHATNSDATLLSTLVVALGGGAVMSLLYVFTRTLWAPIAVHFAWNYMVSVLSAPASGPETVSARDVGFDEPDWLVGRVFGIEPSTLGLALWCLLIAVLALAASRRHLGKSWHQARSDVANSSAQEPVGIGA